MNSKTPNRIAEISFIRVICAFGIAIYHFNGISNCGDRLFYRTANGWWGTVLVTIFFAISGGVLFYNYPKVTNLKQYYYKRWKAIFPAFYLCFAFFFVQNVFKYNTFFYEGRPMSLILSLLGMDGYFLYLVPNYYIVGEWFLGAIIILYILYPFIVDIYKKTPIVLSLLIVVGYIIVVSTRIFKMDNSRNPVTCLLSFFFGIVIMDNRKVLENNKVVMLSLLISVVLIFQHVPIESNIVQHLLGFALFVVLFRIGRCVMRYGKLSSIISKLDNLSFPIFLFQHIVVGKFIGLWNPNGLANTVFWNVIALVYTVICAKILLVLVETVKHSKLMIRLDDRILK